MSPTSQMAMLLADGRLPTGGHTQSGGLEPAVNAGVSADQVPGYLQVRLTTTATVDAATAVVARNLLLTTGDAAPATAAWLARTPSDVIRANAVEVGRGYARLARRLGAGVEAQPVRPIALAHLAVHLSISAAELARIVCHDEVQAVCAAALKLTPMDPLDTVAWAVDAAPAVEDVVAAVQDLTRPSDIPAPTAPAMEIWQHRHASASRRLFRA